jgi:large subunit ribosomal protein L29
MLLTNEIRNQTKDQLTQELRNLKQEQMNLRFQKAYDQLTSPMRVRQVRRQIARIKTIMSEKTYKGAK